MKTFSLIILASALLSVFIHSSLVSASPKKPQPQLQPQLEIDELDLKDPPLMTFPYHAKLPACSKFMRWPPPLPPPNGPGPFGQFVPGQFGPFIPSQFGPFGQGQFGQEPYLQGQYAEQPGQFGPGQMYFPSEGQGQEHFGPFGLFGQPQPEMTSPFPQPNQECPQCPVCAPVYQPVCATDGYTYRNACQFNCARLCNPDLGVTEYAECGVDPLAKPVFFKGTKHKIRIPKH